MAGETIELDEHRFSPEKAKLKIYEGPELRPDEIGMGRGWGNVTRRGEDVTARILDEARRQSAPTLREEAVRALSERLIARAAGGPVGFGEAIALAADGQPGWRASERLAVAEQAVWELLHTGGLALVRDGAPVPKPSGRRSCSHGTRGARSRDPVSRCSASACRRSGAADSGAHRVRRRQATTSAINWSRSSSEANR